MNAYDIYFLTVQGNVMSYMCANMLPFLIYCMHGGNLKNVWTVFLISKYDIAVINQFEQSFCSYFNWTNYFPIIVRWSIWQTKIILWSLIFKLYTMSAKYQYSKSVQISTRDCKYLDWYVMRLSFDIHFFD